jgi:hypothetical protein
MFTLTTKCKEVIGNNTALLYAYEFALRDCQAMLEGMFLSKILL